MVQQVTEAWLTEVCGGRVEELSGPKAYRVAAQMGLLAPWWLREEVIQKARTYAFQLHGETEETRKRFDFWQPVRRVPEESGCCWLLLVNRRPEQLGLLRPAFVLPVRWVKDLPHHSHLPEGLCRLADQVLTQLSTEKQIDPNTRWGLQPCWEWWLACHDLSCLEWQRWESVWVALSGGLLLTYWEGRPNPTVWATGAYQPGQGISRVEGVGPKAWAAWQMGAKVLFVPKGQEEEVRQFLDQQGVDTDLEVLPFPAGPVELRKCLAPYLARLEVPPGPDAPPDRQTAYFLRIPDDAKARQYYAGHILPKVRDRWVQNLKLSSLGATHLVTIVSKGFDLTALAVGVFQPEQCLVLFNQEMAQEAQSLPARLRAIAPQCHFVPREFFGASREDLFQEFQKAIQDFLAGLPPERLLVDLTPGQRIMNLALYDAVPEGSFVIHCQTEMDRQTRRPKPFTEIFELWQIQGQRKWRNPVI